MTREQAQFLMSQIPSDTALAIAQQGQAHDDA